MNNRHRRIMIVLSVAALVGAAFIAWPYLRGAPGPATEFTMVCVVSGEVFTMDVDEVGMIPARNPKSNARTLVPCTRETDGTWRVVARYGDAIRIRLVEVNQVVDPGTLLVRSPE